MLLRQDEEERCPCFEEEQHIERALGLVFSGLANSPLLMNFAKLSCLPAPFNMYLKPGDEQGKVSDPLDGSVISSLARYVLLLSAWERFASEMKLAVQSWKSSS